MTRPAGAPNVTKVGELTLDSPMVGSTYGDTRLFFRHLFFQKELERLSEPRKSRWLDYTNNTEWMKTEGSMLYEPFMK